VEDGGSLQRADLCAILVSLRLGQQLGALVARGGKAQLGGGPLGGGRGGQPPGGGAHTGAQQQGGGGLGRGAGLAGEGGTRVAQHAHGLAHKQDGLRNGEGDVGREHGLAGDGGAG
jgi:hypothetical protein